MLKIERQRLIEEELLKFGSILISDMSAKLDCSEETIRRDIRDLEARNKLKRIHGGAYLPDSEDKGVPTRLRETMLFKEKERMASYVCQHMIRENDTIMLDCSTTCLTIAQHIFISNMKVTIITNSLRICGLFDTHPSAVKLIAIGGTFRSNSSSFSGFQSTAAISSYVADKSFISCPALDIKHGLLDNHSNEAQIRKCFIDHSRQHILVVDHTKFSDIGDHIITSLKDIDVLITDKTLSHNWESVIRQYNLPVHYC